MPESNINDKLHINQEFEAAPAPAEKQKFVREVDLGDGSGVQRFEADSQEALIDKFVEAQVNATRKIQQLARERKTLVEPEKQSSDYQPLKRQMLKPEEITPLQTNPAELFRRMFQAETGISIDEFHLRENDRRRWEAEMRAQDQFKHEHPDFVPSQENAAKIGAFLQKQGLPVSKRNLDYAFAELRAELAGPAAPPEASKAAPQPAPAPARESSTPPSSLRPSLGGQPPAGDIGGGIDAAEYARIERMSNSGDMKARIEQLYRQSRTAR